MSINRPWAPQSVAWRTLAQHSRSRLPERYLPWLRENSSLTERLIHTCPGPFRVQVLSQEWRRPLPEEGRCLGMRAGAVALVREVRLLCAERTWVFARTVIPRTTLTGRQRRLAHLGARPLGAALFAEPTMERATVEIARLVPGDVLFAAAARDRNPAPEEIWGRRSVFTLADKPLLVCEFFLPEIPPVPCR